MAISIPDLPVTGNVIEAAWGIDVRDTIAALDPSGSTENYFLTVNAARTGYDLEQLTHAMIGSLGTTDHAAQISQAEAEAGSATTDRMWTAQRVAQAIAALTGASAPIIVDKSADTGTSSDTTLSNDPHLLAAIGASETWLYRYELTVITQVDPDFKCAFTAPAGVTSVDHWARTYGNYQADPYWTVMQHASGSGTAISLVTQAGNARHVTGMCVVVNGTTGGTVNFQWAQNTSSANATTIKGADAQASYLIATRLV